MEFLKSKLFQFVLLAVAIVGLAVPVGVSLYNPTVDPDFTPVATEGILGPSQAVVGQLVRIKATGEDVQWKAYPETEDFQAYGDENENVNVSFRAPGKYMFIAAALDEDGRPSLSIIEIVVGTSPTTPPNTPGIVPPPAKPTTPVANTALSEQVKQWCVASNTPKSEAGKLGANFNTVANEISSGQLKTPGEILRRTGELNSSFNLEALSTVNGQITSYLTAQAEAGTLVSVEQHQAVWLDIAKGLTSYASN